MWSFRLARARRIDPQRRLFFALIPAALMEPSFQVGAGLQDGMSWLASAALFVYLLGFSASQLWVFNATASPRCTYSGSSTTAIGISCGARHGSSGCSSSAH